MKGDLRGWDLRPKVTLEEEDILEPSTQRSQEEWEWGGSGLWATGWAGFEICWVSGAMQGDARPAAFQFTHQACAEPSSGRSWWSAWSSVLFPGSSSSLCLWQPYLRPSGKLALGSWSHFRVCTHIPVLISPWDWFPATLLVSPVSSSWINHLQTNPHLRIRFWGIQPTSSNCHGPGPLSKTLPGFSRLPGGGNLLTGS